VSGPPSGTVRGQALAEQRANVGREEGAGTPQRVTGGGHGHPQGAAFARGPSQSNPSLRASWNLARQLGWRWGVEGLTGGVRGGVGSWVRGGVRGGVGGWIGCCIRSGVGGRVDGRVRGGVGGKPLKQATWGMSWVCVPEPSSTYGPMLVWAPVAVSTCTRLLLVENPAMSARRKSQIWLEVGEWGAGGLTLCWGFSPNRELSVASALPQSERITIADREGTIFVAWSDIVSRVGKLSELSVILMFS